MSNEDLIRDRLDELHVMFPSYCERSMKELDFLARIFARETQGWSEEKTHLVFDVLLRGKKFPVLDDVLAAGVENKTQQEMDDAKYRVLKGKQVATQWFLSSSEEKFVEKYERENPDHVMLGHSGGGYGLKRLSFGIEENA